jgi:hypothetical protein
MNETGYLTDTGQSYDRENCNPPNVACSPDGTFAVGATTACDFDTDLRSFSVPGLVQVSMKNITGSGPRATDGNLLSTFNLPTSNGVWT